MPPLPAAAKVVRVALVGERGGDSDVVTRHYIQYSGSAPTAAQLNTFCGAVATAWVADLAGLHHSTYTLTSVVAEDLTSSTGATGVANVSDQGTLTGSELPAATAMVIGYTITRRYRGGHPRGYWPMGQVSDVNTPQEWTTAFVAAVATGIASYFTAVEGAGWTGAGTLVNVNLSYYEGFTVVVNPITHRARNVPTLRGAPIQDVITGYNPRITIGSQRRRN